MIHSLIVGLLMSLLLVPPLLGIGIAETQVSQPAPRFTTLPPLLCGNVVFSNTGGSSGQSAIGVTYGEVVLTPHVFTIVTTTELPYMVQSSGAAASPNSTVWGTENLNGGVQVVASGNGFPFAFLRRYQIYAKWLSGSATGRSYLGIGGRKQTNAAATSLNTDTLATGAAGMIFAGFRFSATTDATWKGVVCDGLVAQTVVDLGVVPDANPHRFRMDYDGVKISWYIDDILLGSTNFSVVSSVMVFNSVDNKNVAAAAQISWNSFWYVLNR
jgi:hypothetical protein